MICEGPFMAGLGMHPSKPIMPRIRINLRRMNTNFKGYPFFYRHVKRMPPNVRAQPRDPPDNTSERLSGGITGKESKNLTRVASACSALLGAMYDCHLCATTTKRLAP